MNLPNDDAPSIFDKCRPLRQANLFWQSFLPSKAPTAEDISSLKDVYLSPALSGTLTVSDLRWLVGALLKQDV